MDQTIEAGDVRGERSSKRLVVVYAIIEMMVSPCCLRPLQQTHGCRPILSLIILVGLSLCAHGLNSKLSDLQAHGHFSW